LNIKEYVDLLTTSQEAISGAPQKGFVDLDMVKDTLLKTRQYLEQIAPQLELGNQLKEDFTNNLKAKIRALRLSGGGQLINQAEKVLSVSQPDFAELKSLQQDIDQMLTKIFGALSGPAGSGQPSKIEDFQ
jgi:hypothetical protein